LRKADSAKLKCCAGGLHQPGPLLLGGQEFVAVTTTDPGLHHFGSLTHLIAKQAPQDNPLLNKAALRAVVSVPYPSFVKSP